MVNAEPWREILPRKCKVVGAAPISAGTGALLGLVVIALLVFEADRRMPR
jgi:hypothetical protein